MTRLASLSTVLPCLASLSAGRTTQPALLLKIHMLKNESDINRGDIAAKIKNAVMQCSRVPNLCCHPMP